MRSMSGRGWGSVLVPALLVAVALGCSGKTATSEGAAGVGQTAGGADGGATAGRTGTAGVANDPSRGGGQDVAADGGETVTVGGSSAVGGALGAGGAVGGMASDEAGGEGGNVVHDRCAAPQRLELVDGHVSVSDDTERGTDEFPTLVCGDPRTTTALKGPQLYYEFSVRPGLRYEFRLKSPDFFGNALYVFPAAAACTVEAIQGACQSGGEAGLRAAANNDGPLIPFAPRDPGPYVAAVDTESRSSGPFTLSIFEYCATDGATGCKTKVCDADTGATCHGNARTTCNSDGTGYVETDCAATGELCHEGACLASVADTFGTSQWPTGGNDAGADGATLFDFYAVSASRTLTEIQVLLTQFGAIPLVWSVYEATTQAGPYRSIFTNTTTSGGTSAGRFESTGAINVPLLAGRFYAIGLSVPARTTYDYGVQDKHSLPIDISFGQVVSAVALPTVSPAATIAFAAPGNFVFRQRLTTKL